MRHRRSQVSWLRAVRADRARSRPTRHRRTVALLLASGVVGAAVAGLVPGVQAVSDGTYRDGFDTVTYAGSNGTIDWSSSPWVEIGESDGPSLGFVRLLSTRCSSGDCLWLDDNSPGVAIGAARTADLSGAGSAVLTFSFQKEQDIVSTGTEFYVEVAATPGGTFSRLATFVVDTTDTAPRPVALDISGWVSASTTIRFISNGANTDNEIYVDDVQIEATPAGAAKPALWFTIRDDTTTGPTGLTTFDDGAIGTFDEPGVAYEPGITSGTLAEIADWSALAANVDISGMHLVGTAMTIGGSIQVLPGDILFNVDVDTSLPSGAGTVAVQRNDVVRFRPTTPGDYSSGDFVIALDNPLGVELRGLTLVESSTQVGEVLIPAGSFLLTRHGAAEHQDVWWYTPTSAGEGTTAGTTVKLLEGSEMGFSDQIWGIDLVEDGMGWPFPRGAIALTVEQPVLFGVDGVAMPKWSIFSAIVARTSVSGTARVAGVLAWDGGDLGFNEDSERLDGFTFADVDLPPVFGQDLGDRTDAEGDAVSLSAAATDPLGDTLTYSASGLPAGVSIDSGTGLVSGTISQTAATDSPYAVTLTVTDPGGLTDTDTFTWTVTEVNVAPVVTSPSDQSGAEGDVVSLALTGSDADLDIITWTAVDLPPGLSIDAATGVISGTIDYVASPASPYAVTVRATDDAVPPLFTEVAFTWTVADTNRAPSVGNPGDQTNVENDVVTVPVVGTDADGNGLTWSATGLPSGLSISPTSGVVSGTIGYDGAGTHAVTVRATDDGAPILFTEVQFTWTVGDVNRPPVVTDPGGRSNAENDPVTFAMAGSDPDGDTITWSATGLPDGLVIDPGTGVIAGTLSYAASTGSPYAVTVRATDDGAPGLFGEAAFTWEVSNTNRAPSVTAPSDLTGAEGDTVSLAVAGADPDGDTLSWSATGLPGGLGIDPATGVISGTIGFSASVGSPYTVTVRATDDDVAPRYAEVSFSWSVADTNRVPVVTSPGDQSRSEGDPVTFAVAGSDPDGDTVTWSASGLPPGLSIDTATGVVSGTIDYAASAGSPYAVTVRAIDDGTPALLGEASFAWTVVDTNRAPLVTSPGDQRGAENDAPSLAVVGSDPDGDTLWWTVTGLPSGLSIDPATGVISGTLTYSSSGIHPVTVRATDDGMGNLSTEVQLTWTVVDTNRPPAMTDPGPQSDTEGDVVMRVFSGSDPDGDLLVWSATGLPLGLSIDPATGVVSGLVADTASVGSPYAVTVRAADEGAPSLFAEAMFTWTVIESDYPPVVGDDLVRVAVDDTGGGVVVDVTGNDSDPEGAALSIVSVTQPEVGRVAIAADQVLFTPPANWLGTVRFAYVVSDAGGNESTARVTIIVEESLATKLAASALQWDPVTPPAPPLEELEIDPGAGTELVLSTVVQSLYVLRLPLALLGGAIFWSLLLGGLLNLGFVLKDGIPRVVRRTSRHVAVVMIPHGEKLDALSEPGGGTVVWQFLATDRGVEATGRRAGRWAEVETPHGAAWVPTINLTEEVDKAGFADDSAPVHILEEFVDRLRTRQDVSGVVSEHGLAVAHHGPVELFTPQQVPLLMEDSSVRTWKGRNPAYPDFHGTFDLAIATSFLDAWDHPERLIVHDSPTVPSTVLPVEFTNFHTISVGADVHGPARLDQSAWIVAFSFEGGRPRIVGLVKEG